MIIGNTSSTHLTQETQEIQLDTEGPLTLDLSDDEVNSIIGKRVADNKAFWDKEVDLTTAQKKNESYWMNASLDEKSLYDFQVPYKNNRIFSAIETLIPIVLTNAPQPVVTQAFDTDASYELAQNVQKVLLALWEDLYLKQKFTMVTRHLLVGYRFAALKYRWDANRGAMNDDGTRKGGMVIEWVRPQKLVLDRGANDSEDIPLISEYVDTTIEELLVKFPSKKADIYRKFGGQQSAEKNKSSRIQYLENWFTYWKDGKRGEGLCWIYQDLVLDKMKNPHWVYEETKKGTDGKKYRTNFFDRPMKPYIIFNYLNLGKYVIDETSLTEQAAPLQDVLDKRGRQIVENADQANSGTVYNEEMISQEDVAKITGDPKESVMVKGNVNAAASRLPINLLPDYVIADKNDARAEIDNLYGTNAPLRGESSNSKTLGQEVISQRSNMSRLQTLADSIEDGADKLFKAELQMMKVFWDEPTMIKYTGDDGKTTFLEFSQEKIEEGMSVRVKAGSVLPKDKETTRQITMKLAPLLDPLSLAEGLDEKNPKEWASRNVTFKLDPMMYMQKYLQMGDGSGNDQKAAADLSAIVHGQQVPPPDSPTKEYMATFNNFLNSPEFSKLPPQIQQLLLQFVKTANENAKKGLGIQGQQDQAQPTSDAGTPADMPQQAAQPQPGNAPPAAMMQPPPAQATQGFGQPLQV